MCICKSVFTQRGRVVYQRAKAKKNVAGYCDIADWRDNGAAVLCKQGTSIKVETVHKKRASTDYGTGNVSPTMNKHTTSGRRAVCQRTHRLGFTLLSWHPIWRRCATRPRGSAHPVGNRQGRVPEEAARASGVGCCDWTRLTLTSSSSSPSFRICGAVPKRGHTKGTRVRAVKLEQFMQRNAVVLVAGLG